MAHVAKIAISIPPETLGEVEIARQARGESRSQYFRRAAEALIAQERQEDLDEQYVRAYRAMPEVPDLGLLRAGLEALAEDPWEAEEGD